MEKIVEPAKEVPVIEDVDICVLGGGCTGVFAAVRAARLGAKVVIVEKNNSFGGVATAALVNIWHSFYDTAFEKQIIAGLSQEVIERLCKRDAVKESSHDINAYTLNTEELKIELDELIKEANVKPYLHTYYVAPYKKGNKLKGVFVENKSGRGFIKARIFIDATGDGDLCADLNLTNATKGQLQPPTTCAKIYGMNLENFNLEEAIKKYGAEFELPEDWGWRTSIPGLNDIQMYAENHVFGVNCSKADELTYAEIEGRRQVRAIMDLVRKYGPGDKEINLVDLASTIGIRETRHIVNKYKIKEQDLLQGKPFDDAIAYGTYRVDIHHDEKPGITFRYLDGREVYIRRGQPPVKGSWKDDDNPPARYYQLPFRSLIPGRIDNLIMAGRMIDAEPGAFGAIRVMVNLNQLGEAAGVAAYLALESDSSIENIDIFLLRKTLKKGGSIILG